MSEATPPAASDLTRVEAKELFDGEIVMSAADYRADIAAARAEGRREGWDDAEKCLVRRQRVLQEKYGNAAPQWAIEAADWLAANKPGKGDE